LSTRIFAIVLLLYALGLAIPGGVLLSLCGSGFYLLAGIVSLGCAILLWRGDSRAVSIFAALLVATLLWAVWESGWDGWALLPRIGLPILLGLWFAAASARSALHGSQRFATWIIIATSLAGIGLIVAAVLWQPASASMSDHVVGAAVQPGDGDWPEYGREKGGTRFSPLSQITRENVGQLEVAWTYRVGIPKNLRVALQVTPLKIGDRLYLCAGNSDVISLNAETGRQVWRFAAKADPAGVFAGVCRGVSYFRVPDGSGPASARAERPRRNTLHRFWSGW
jgi:quinoprotein glucose dehydrogenase